MRRKVQSQLLVSLPTRQRADALALVRNEARAEIFRAALEGGGLRELEVIHAPALAELDKLAEKFKMTRLELAGRAADDGLSLQDLRELKRYPERSAK